MLFRSAFVPASTCLCIRTIINLSKANVYFIFIRQMCCCACRVVLQRKVGLFKKAYELGVLFSVNVAVIIFGAFETVLCSAVFLLLIPFFRSPLAFPNCQFAPLRHSDSNYQSLYDRSDARELRGSDP